MGLPFIAVVGVCADEAFPVPSDRTQYVAMINAQTDEQMFAAPHVEGELMVRFRPCGITQELCAVTGFEHYRYRRFCTDPIITRFHENGAQGEMDDAACMLEDVDIVVIRFFGPPLLPAGQSVASRIGLLAHVYVPPPTALAEARTALMALPKVEYVCPVYLYEPTTVPNDPDFALQWGLRNTGQVPPCITTEGGTPGEDISAVAAWEITTGSHEVKVAVIDSGVKDDHPDLVGNVGAGLNFTGIPGDMGGHGTGVAGVIGAVGNNGIGIAGVAWEVTMLPYTMFAPN